MITHCSEYPICLPLLVAASHVLSLCVRAGPLKFGGLKRLMVRSQQSHVLPSEKQIGSRATRIFVGCNLKFLAFDHGLIVFQANIGVSSH